MTLYMLVDATPLALPRGVYDSLEEIAAALGLRADSLYSMRSRYGYEKLYRLGREKVRIIRVRQAEEKHTVKLARKPPERSCSFPGLAAMMVEEKSRETGRFQEHRRSLRRCGTTGNSA